MSAAQDEFNELMRDKERRTTHPEDDDGDARSFLNLSDDEDDDATPVASTIDPDDDAISRPSSSISRNTIPHTRYEANTGPKGVISDAQNFRDQRRIHRISMRSNSTLPAQADGRRPSTQSEKISESDEEDEDDADDPAFMRKWRKSRLRELRNGSYESKMHNRRKSSHRIWGGMTTVDGGGYLEAVEKSPADVVVAVYIFDDYVSLCPSYRWCISY